MLNSYSGMNILQKFAAVKSRIIPNFDRWQTRCTQSPVQAKRYGMNIFALADIDP